MSAALSLMAACRPATPFTDRVIALRASWDDDRDDELAPRRRGGCQCFGPGEGPGRCPGPEHCPMCEDDDE